MAITSTRKTILGYTGDLEATETVQAASNLASPYESRVLTLASGANTITAPTGGTTPVAATIIPPAGNTVQVTLKGVTGDTGILLHLTDPTTIAIAAAQTSFVLTAASALTGLRILWS